MKRKTLTIIFATTMMLTAISFCPNPTGKTLGDIINKSLNKPTPPQPFPSVIIDEAK